MNEVVRIGFVGAGFMGQIAHLANFAEIEGCTVVAIADRRQELARLVARRFNIPKVYPSHHELLKDDEVEAVVAILPIPVTPVVAKDVLASGRHLMTEKPMACSYRTAEQLAEIADTKRLKYMIGFNKRHDPGVQFAQKAVAERKKEEVITFARSHCYGGEWICGEHSVLRTEESVPQEEIPDTRPEWMNEEMKSKFVWFLNVWSHDINLMRYFLGEGEVLSARFRGNTGLVLFEFGGTIATLEIGGVQCHRWDEHIQVYFADGWVRCELPPPLLKNVSTSVEVYLGGEEYREMKNFRAHRWSFRAQAEHFVGCLREDKEPLSSGRDCARGMALAEEIFRQATFA